MAVLGGPQSQAPVTTTVINIRSETSVPDHIVWSLFNTIFMHWCCLGFVAFAYSVESRDRKMVGDIIGARSYVSAKCLNICALVLGLLLITVLIIIVSTSSLMIVQTVLGSYGTVEATSPWPQSEAVTPFSCSLYRHLPTMK